MERVSSSAPTKEKVEIRLKGLPVSDGVAIGTLFFLPTASEEVICEYIIEEELIDGEVARYAKAVDRSREDLRFLQESLQQEDSKEAIEVVEAHIQMLQDPLITEEVEREIRDSGKNAEFVFSKTMKAYEQQFSKIEDAFFQQRMADVLDMSRRIFDHLFQKAKVNFSDIPASSIIFTKELAPSHTAAIQASRIGGFVTQGGGSSCHAALIARAKGIPYVCHVDLDRIDLCHEAVVIIDGSAGEVVINPSEETLSKYRQIKTREKTTYKLLQQDVHPLIETVDGYPISIHANVGSIADLKVMHKHKTEGIGLFRSEYLFLEKNIVFLSEKEQLEAYKKVIKEAQDLPLVMRVFDTGGDKNPDMFLEQAKEANPVLGCRGIRFLLKHPAVFRTQLRAIMQAAGDKDVKILLPLVSDVQEIHTAKKLIDEVRKELVKEGAMNDRTFQVGCMIEVPSVVFLADAIAKEVDFLSIGTNDLVQYTLGVDRGNPSMSDCFCPAHPSLIRMIKMVVVEANRQGKPVTVCGEIASSPLFIPLLVGLGVSELSCSPRYIPLVKRAVRRCTLLSAFKLAQRALRLSSSKEVMKVLQEEFREETLSSD